MRSLWLTAALAVALMLDGCRGKRRPEPVPGPQSATAHAAAQQHEAARYPQARRLFRL
jgi:hypothetical protein